jgi:uncharacterized protein YciI
MHFFLKLIPSRPTFSQDMTDEERGIMLQHIAYWVELMKQGKVIVFGPVSDPKGVYGMGVIDVENEEDVIKLTSRDPALAINTYEWWPMRALVPEK